MLGPGYSLLANLCLDYMVTTGTALNMKYIFLSRKENLRVVVTQDFSFSIKKEKKSKKKNKKKK